MTPAEAELVDRRAAEQETLCAACGGPRRDQGRRRCRSGGAAQVPPQGLTGAGGMADLFPLVSRVRGDDGRRQTVHVITCGWGGKIWLPLTTRG